jgi:hypothetical protein
MWIPGASDLGGGLGPTFVGGLVDQPEFRAQPHQLDNLPPALVR